MSGGREMPNVSAPAEPAEASDATYEVGRGKPPVETRFRKGRSGNPKGRPKKVRPEPPRFGDGHVARSFEKALLKKLKVNEGGKRVDMTVSEAFSHKMASMALAGNRLMLQYLDKRAREEEARAQAEAEEHYWFWRDYKARQEAKIAAERKAGEPVSHPLPHPADIQLDPARTRVRFLGPINAEEVAPYAYCLRLCELMAGLAELDRRHRRAHQLPEPDLCLFSLLATLLHRLLPPSYGSDDAYALVTIKMAWRSPGNAQLRNRIAHLQLEVYAWTPSDDGPWMVRHPGNERYCVALERIADLVLETSTLVESKAPIEDATIAAIVRKVLAQNKSGRTKGVRNQP